MGIIVLKTFLGRMEYYLIVKVHVQKFCNIRLV